MAIGFFDSARVLVAWCETRGAFRHFRVDRIAAAEARPERYPPPPRGAAARMAAVEAEGSADRGRLTMIGARRLAAAD